MPDKPPINLDDFDFGNTIRGHQKGDRVFERFQLRRLLGRGGMGVVWLAMDERLGREVALKFAPESIRYDEILVEELKEETRKGLELAHPNIVKIYDFLFDEENAAISMEFIDGENLGSLRTHQPSKVFEVDHITHWVAQLLDALDYAHRVARVIHRDLKPANLMIDRDGHLRVTDFGIARTISDAMDRATLGGEPSTGTLAYMSPQQANGRKPSTSDDIYSLGSTIYELLTGKPPFYTGNIAHQLSSEPVIPPSARRLEFGITTCEAIPADWEKTVLACLEKDPANRPQSAARVRELLGLVPMVSTSTIPKGVSAALSSSTPPPVPPPLPVGVSGSPPPPPVAVSGPPTIAMTEVQSNTIGMTQIGMTAAPISLNKVKVGAAATPAAEEEPPPPTLRGEKKGGIGMVLGLAVMLAMLAFLGAGGWMAFKYVLPLFINTPVKEDPSKTGPKKGPDIVYKTEPKKDIKKEPKVEPKVEPKKGPEVTTTPKDDPIMPKVPDAPKFTTIQAAINQAKPGETVTIPEGTYEEQIKFKEGIHLKAAVIGKVIVQTDGSTGSALMADACPTGSVTGITFQHTGKDVVENVTWPVVMMKSSSVSLSDCIVQSGVGDGLWLTGAGKPQLKRCTFRQNTRIGLVIESGSSASVEACEARKNGGSGIEVRLTGTSPKLIGNLCADNGGSGIAVKDGAAAAISEECKLQNNVEAGIAIVGEGTSSTVTNAVCELNLVGITVQKGAKASVAGCTVTDSRETGILFDMAANGCGVTGNTVEKSKFDGLLITGASGIAVAISNNKVRVNGGNGILVFGANFKPAVERNQCEKNGQHGILIAEGSSGTVRGNTTRENNLSGIAQEKAAADVVIEGNQSEEPAR
jgi:parallel beta-helix repeat protein